MSYYPILKAPGCSGWVTLCNFPPNNWEIKSDAEKFVNVTWAEDGNWNTANLGKLSFGAMRTICMNEISGLIPAGVLPFLSLTATPLPSQSDVLPVTDTGKTNVPAWRATLGLKTDLASTSYQGEIDPFPATGSLLTFPPFMQFGEDVENYLIFLNLEAKAVDRSGLVEIYNSAAPDQLCGSFEVRSNSATAIHLDGLGLESDDLPVLICRQMSGIPLYLSRTQNGSFLTLEHTHPPASYVIHGKRWEAQKILKILWFSKTEQ